MSPEQARGESLDARTDLFSVGIVMYEMVTGRRPFDGPSIADTVSAILNSEPVSLTALRPGAPAELTRIVVKLLRKDRDERYRSAADLLVDLRSLLRQIPGSIVPVTRAPPVTGPPARRAPRGWVLPAAVGAAVLVAVGGWAVWRTGRGGGGGAPHIASLAVLPLDNMSADKSQDYFAAAMTEELTRELSGIKSLVVKSRTSTEQYKDTRRSMPEIARALNADGIIEGSVLRDGDRVRITAQLIYGPADQHLWANSYEGDLHDVLSLQRRVAEAIAREVRAVVTPEEQQTLHEGRSIDPKAMELYLRGRESLCTRHEHGEREIPAKRHSNCRPWRVSRTRSRSSPTGRRPTRASPRRVIGWSDPLRTTPPRSSPRPARRLGRPSSLDDRVAGCPWRAGLRLRSL